MKTTLAGGAALVAALVWLIVGAVREDQHQRATATYQSVGKLLDCQPIPVAWNDFPRTRVETTRGVFIVDGNVSALKGSAVTLASDGFLFIEGNPYGSRLCDR